MAWLDNLAVKRGEAPEATIAGLRQALEQTQVRSRKLWWLLWLSWLPFLLFALLYIVGIVLHQRIAN